MPKLFAALEVVDQARGRNRTMKFLRRLAMLVALSAVITGCAFQAGTRASIPAGLASYEQVFDAATELVTRAGYSVARADRPSGTITGLKQVGGESLHFNMVVKRVSDTGIDVTLIRVGGFPLPRAVWKADAKQMLRHLAGAINVPESKIMVTFDNDTKPLDQF
jgi:hypothetical protein